MKAFDLNVKGMTCGSCVASVTRALQNISGVAYVAVDLQGGTARVGTSADVGIETLASALGSAGYSSGPKSEEESRPHAVAPFREVKGGCCCS